jgi:hypothetical protein
MIRDVPIPDSDLQHWQGLENQWALTVENCVSAVERVTIMQMCANCTECPSRGSTENPMHTKSYSPPPPPNITKKGKSQMTGSVQDITAAPTPDLVPDPGF